MAKHKRVLVTAGAAGIGRAIVQAFAAAGARVHVCDLDAGALAVFLASDTARSISGQIMPIDGDSQSAS